MAVIFVLSMSRANDPICIHLFEIRCLNREYRNKFFVVSWVPRFESRNIPSKYSTKAPFGFGPLGCVDTYHVL
jgi:hypothetical protein